MDMCKICGRLQGYHSNSMYDIVILLHNNCHGNNIMMSQIFDKLN